MDYTPYKLKSWVNESKLDKNLLSLNPRAMHYLFNKINNEYDNFVKLNGLSKNVNGHIYYLIILIKYNGSSYLIIQMLFIF